jgi:hypothetical protein
MRTLLAFLVAASLMPALSSAQMASNGARELGRGVFVPQVNTQDKLAVARHYQNFYYWPGQFTNGVYGRTPFPINKAWTGSIERCEAGTISDAARQAGIRQVNFFRSLVGLSNVHMGDAEGHAKAQAAALIVGANSKLTHFPSSTDKCYSELGAKGSAESNLSFAFASNFHASNLEGYISDGGDSNYSVGHRRSLLYPAYANMAYGVADFAHSLLASPLSGANALWIDLKIAPTFLRPAFVAWPYAGWNPDALLPVSSNRWSFSCLECDFDSAVVEMRKDGQLMAAPRLEKLENKLGIGDNTIVWLPNGVNYGLREDPLRPFDRTLYLFPLEREATYTVTVKNVGVPTCVSGGGCINFVKRDFTYDVKVFDVQKTLETANIPRLPYDGQWSAADGSRLAVTALENGQFNAVVTSPDANGRLAWAMASAGRFSDATTLSGELMAFVGADLSVTASAPVATSNGQLRVDFLSETTAMAIIGSGKSIAFKRDSFGDGVYTDGGQFSGLWTGDNGSFAVSIGHEFSRLIGQVLYFEGGVPRSLSFGTCNWVGNGCQARVMETRMNGGLTSFKIVGSINLRFTNDYSATASLNLYGRGVLTNALNRTTGAPFSKHSLKMQQALPIDYVSAGEDIIRRNVVLGSYK